MKEVTVWDNNPRWMWVWDDNEEKKVSDYVVYILSSEELDTFDVDRVKTVCKSFKHCAEIEEIPKKETRLTNYELSQLRKCIGVEISDYSGKTVYNEWSYSIEKENEEILVNYKIRYRQGEWMPATRETVWKWWRDETPDSDIAKIVSFLGWDKE